MENKKQIDYASIDYSVFREAVRKAIRTTLFEKNQKEINAEKAELKARIDKTKEQIKALQDKLPTLTKLQQQANQQKPDETEG